MDLSSPSPTTNSPLSTPSVFADNVQDLLGTGTLHVNPSAIITVNSIADGVDDFNSGVTTLRDAINQANADDGEDLIVFDRSKFSSAQTITLSLGELDITHNLDIIAPRDELTGADLVTVSGNKASRVFEIEPGATVTLSGLIVADGRRVRGDLTVEQANKNSRLAIDNGGGIKNSGTLTLDSSIVRNNSSPDPTSNISGAGGGIYNTGTLEVSNSTISGNNAGLGGGIYNTGTLEVSNSTISGNRVGTRFLASGGGIYNTGTAKVFNSTFNDNLTLGLNSGAEGGGIFNEGNLTVSTSTLNNNSVTGHFSDGGGIFNTNTGTLEVINSTLSGNSAQETGGGIANGGNSIIKNSTLSGNSAPQGGGIENFGTMTVSNSTLSGNSASGKSNTPVALANNGGGIYNSRTLTLVFSTLTLNSAANGGGVFNNPSSPSLNYSIGSARNTIIASNLLNENGVNPDVSGTFSSNGYNLIGDSTGSTGFGSLGDLVGTSDNPIDPRLAPLDFYGGPTQTISLLPDSPAIDAGDPTVLDTDSTTDQRGLPRVSNVGSDIGAFEAQV